MNSEWIAYFTVGWLAIWFLFPIGLFLSEAYLDRDSDQVFQLARAREKRLPVATKKHFHFRWPHVGDYFRRSLKH